MAAPSEGFWQRRGALGLYELLLTWWRHRVSFVISVVITLLALVLYYFTFVGERTTPIFNFIQRLEYDSLDTRFRYRPRSATPIDPRIVIVDIDQHSQEVLGKWPFSRTHFANMLDVLREAGAKVVAFDVTFSKPDQSAAPIRALWAEMEARRKRGETIDPLLSAEVQKLATQYDADKQFATAIQRFGAVVLGNFFLHTEADLRGLDDKTLDTYANQIAFYSFPSVRPLRPETGKQDRIGLMIANLHGPGYTYSHYSLADVVEKKISPDMCGGKIVLVGATATGIGDLRTTPYGGLDYPGVEIHANVIDCILHQSFLYRGAKQTLADVLLVFFFGIPLGIWMALVTPRWMWFGAFLIVPLVAVDYFAFLHGWWLNFGVPALTLSSNVLLVSLYRALFEDKEKRRVRSAFGQYLSPEVIRRLLVNPRLVEPKKTDITVMFSDIRGFTTISEKLDAQDLANFLNQYLSDMTRLVFEHHGTLDKYIGDAVMAFWGAPFEEPGHAARACNTALKMMERVREMQKKWESEGKPHLDIGIGLNTGVASVGNMGSALRYGYTALGDTVNLSSRLEGLNKDYGTHILVNETTYTAAKDDGFLFRELDLIRVKGKLQPVAIYELIGRAAENSIYGTPDEVRNRLDLFQRAHELYRQRRWEAARQSFQTILDRWPDDGPSRAYWKRCQEYLFDEPPSGWDGVFTMTHK